METPSSARRITRSQALGFAQNSSKIPMSRKFEESEKGVAKSRQRSGKQQALIDITNDSPIVGLAMGSLETPSSTFSKKRIVMNNNGQEKHATTPGSGEALLRGQVKTLLQKVEEEAVLSKISLEYRPFQGLVNSSPMDLLAPTPANTPQISDLSANDAIAQLTSPVEEHFKISQMLADIIDGRKEESDESEKILITRSLLLDFSEKSDSSDCTSVLTYQGCENKSSSTPDDDDASVWSVQVNASTRDEEEEEEEEDAELSFEDEEEDDYEEDEEEGLLVDELCEGMSKISVNGSIMAQFNGKHKRFVYNSDDELVEEECEDNSTEERETESWSSSSSSLGILRLKGLPTPKGKHLRFPEDS